MRLRPRSVIVPGAQSRGGVTTSDNRPAPADLSQLSPGNQLLERAHCLILLPQRSSSLRPCVVVVPSLFAARDLKNHHSLKTSCGCISEIVSSNIYINDGEYISYKFGLLCFFFFNFTLYVPTLARPAASVPAFFFASLIHCPRPSASE